MIISLFVLGFGSNYKALMMRPSIRGLGSKAYAIRKYNGVAIWKYNGALEWGNMCFFIKAHQRLEKGVP